MFPRSNDGSTLVPMCLIAFIGLAAPRFALFLMWIFTGRLSQAFDSFVIGALGFALLPFTTMFYALAHQAGTGVGGFGYVLVGLGLLLDLGSYGNGGQQGQKYRQTR